MQLMWDCCLIQNYVSSCLCLEKSRCSRVLLKVGGAQIYMRGWNTCSATPDKMAVCSDFHALPGE